MSLHQLWGVPIQVGNDTIGGTQPLVYREVTAPDSHEYDEFELPTASDATGRATVEAQLARLRMRGATLASPYRDKANFKGVLLELCPAHAFDDSVVRHWYEMLSVVIGRGLSEQQRLEVSPVAKRLRSTGISLDEIARTLQGHETGFHTDIEIEVVSQIKNYLALDPAVGVDKADKHTTSLRDAASIVARACL